MASPHGPAHHRICPVKGTPYTQCCRISHELVQGYKYHYPEGSVSSLLVESESQHEKKKKKDPRRMGGAENVASKGVPRPRDISPTKYQDEPIGLRKL